MTADEQAIRQVVADWITFTQEERIDELADLMTEDMLFLTVKHPPMTKAEFVAGHRSMKGTVKIECQSEIHEVRVEGNFGWLWQELSVKFAMGDKEPVSMKGKTMGIYRKGEDGKWRLMRDANMMP
ncbi:YybH family protein [Terriglobus tenax]|uniref:YybH family protein n=1 Tax=Terriglobus tenax TaxID=1111115 RepID=UPI0021DF83C8|nr:SgcJ/EcaC family oxidoreductase [Terriglobus tenax]